MESRFIKPIILFEDNHFLALDKPAMVLTQDSPIVHTSLESGARAFIKERDGKPGKVYLHAAHRLDKEAFGIVLLVKTSKALSRLHKTIQTGGFSKHYLALVAGKPETDQGVWEDWLTHGHLKAFVGKKEGARFAKLSFEVSAKYGSCSLLSIQLETGRYHQVRVQSSHRDLPIAGDEKYGSHIKSGGKGIALCHKTLKFTHPVTKEEVVIESKQGMSAWL